MPDPIQIRIVFKDDGTVAGIDQVGNSLETLDRKAKSSGSGFDSLIRGATDLKSTFDIISGSISQGAGIIDGLNQVGVASLRAKAGFEAMGGTSAVLDQMMASTKGLVDDTALLASSTQALSAGAVQSTSQLAELSRIGATLGLTFQGSAEGGIELFTRDLEAVGNTRGLKQLGIDAQAVKKEYDALKDSMGEQAAWQKSVFDVAGQRADQLAGQLEAPGTALQKLKVQWEDLKETFAEKIAAGIEIDIKVVQGMVEGFNKINEASPVTAGRYDPVHGYGASIVPGPKVTDWNTYSDWFWKHPEMSPEDAARVSGLMFPANWGTANYGGNVGSMFDQMGRAWGGLRNYYTPGAFPNQPGGPSSFYSNLESATFWANEYPKPRVSLPDENNARLAFQIKEAYAESASAIDEMSNALGRHKREQDAVVMRIVEANDLIKKQQEAYQQIGGQLEGGIAQAIDERRRAMERAGASQKQLAAYDEQAITAMEAYRLATGQVTQEQLNLGHTTDNLSEAFIKGRMSLDQYTQAEQDLAKAAAEGKKSVEELNRYLIEHGDMNWQFNFKAPQKPLTKEEIDYVTSGGQKPSPPYRMPGAETPGLLDLVEPTGGYNPLAGRTLPGGMARLDRELGRGGDIGDWGRPVANPFQEVERGADQAMSAIHKLSTETLSTAVQMVPGGLAAAFALSPIDGAAKNAQNQIRAIAGALDSLNGKTVTMKINVEGSNPLNGNGGGGARGYVRTRD